MANLKALRNRIKSVKSTQKITKAMKVVAASKLRRAQERAQSARPYAEKMERVLATLAQGIESPDNAPKLLVGNGADKRHLLVVMTSDRGLCGGFNTTVCRGVKREIDRLQRAGKEVKVIMVGKKGYDQLKGNYTKNIVHRIQDLSKAPVTYVEAAEIGDKVLGMFEAGEFDVCSVVFNKFLSAIAQEVTFQQLIPLDITSIKVDTKQLALSGGATYDYEPSEEAVLADLLPRNISVQILKALLESAASEQGARMTAMDNATRNAGDMIKKLTLEYNRSRQAAITKELIEIISGAEAV